MNKNFVYIKGKTIFTIFLTAFILVSTAAAGIVNVAAASPETTHFFVDPPEVSDVLSGGTFSINIMITEAPDSYSWEIHIAWDPDLLELNDLTEGDFLHRGAYTTNFLSTSISEANVQGEIMIGCSLSGDVPWASGDGWLVSLDFTVEATGNCILNLFDTWLADHLIAGSPKRTYYSNLDGFFSNVDIHDVAVTSVTANTTSVDPGEPVAINVTVTNEGDYSETFNVEVYADATAYEYEYDITGRVIRNTTVVGDEITVGTQTVTDLAIDATTTLTFTWSTTGVAGDTYTISAEVMGDDDTRNNLFIDGSVTVAVPPAHDIAITNVVPSATEVTVGDSVTISVTVENQGEFDETFNVTVYHDDTAIETETDVTLASGSSTTLTFTWDTTDVAKDTYTIKAEAVVTVDDDTADNLFTDGTVKVRGAAAPNVLIYAVVGAVAAIAIIAAVIYFVKFRK